MRNIHVTIVAGAALLCSAMLAVAQEREQRGQGGPAAKQGGPPSGAGPERAGPPSRGPGIERGEGRGMREPRTDMPHRREPAARNTEERGRRTPNQIPNQAERKERPDQTIERGRQEGSPPAAGLKERERFDRTDRRPTQGAERKPGEQPAAQTVQRHEQIRQTRSRLSNEQQVRLRSSFDVRRDRVTKANFAVRVGTRIPHSIRLFAIPAAVISIVPAYSYYRYAALEDRICIVDPETYEIVDMIDEGAYAAGPLPIGELRLTSSERALVLDSIAPDFPSAPVRLRLALGAEIPRSVELHSFPDVVLDRIPNLRNFQFIVIESDVVVVNLRDRGIALIIER